MPILIHYDSPQPISVSHHRGNAGYEEHSHDCNELVFAVKGSATHVVNGLPYAVRAGDVYVINPGTVHAYRDSLTLVETLVAFTPPMLCSPATQVRTLSAFHTLFLLAPTDPDVNYACRLRLPPADLSAALAIVDRVEAELATQREGYATLLNAFFAELVVFLCRRYREPASDAELVRGTLRMARVTSHIEAHYDDALTLDSLAEVAGMSRRHLTRLFRTTYGVSPMDYVVKRRIRHAATLLVGGSLSVTEVAFASGFADSNYFARQFRRLTGVSPSQYRAAGQAAVDASDRAVHVHRERCARARGRRRMGRSNAIDRTLAAALVVSAAAFPAAGAVAGAAGAAPIVDVVRDAVVAGVSSGRRESFAVCLGRDSWQRARVSSADAEGVAFTAGQMRAKLAWDRLQARSVADLAAAYLPAGDADARVALARYCVDNGLVAEARDVLDALRAASPGARDRSDVQDLVRTLASPPAAAPGASPVPSQQRRPAPAARAAAAPAGATSRLARRKGELWSAEYAPVTPPRTGYYDDWLKDPATGAAIIKYAVQAPGELPARRTLGLVVAFHGATGNEASHFWIARTALEKTGLVREYVVVGGKSKGVGWTRADEEPVTRLIEWAIETYPIDRRRVVFHGYSSGAMMIGRWGTSRLDLAAGAVTVAGSFQRVPHPAKGQAASAGFYLIHGDRDASVSVQARARDDSAALERAGYPTVFREIDGLDHITILNSPGEALSATYADSARWLHWLRHAQVPLSREDAGILDGLAARDVDTVWTDESAVATIVRIGGDEAGALVQSALGSGEPRVRIRAAEACAVASFGAEVESMVLRLLADSDPDVRSAAARTATTLSVWRHPAAQAALTGLAMDARRPVAERVLGVRCLAETIRLQVIGNLADGPVFRALVDLLADRDRGVRSAAHAAIAPALPPSFAYDPDASSSALRASWARAMEWWQGQFGDGRARTP